MSLGATAKITAPANTWTPLSSGQTSVYFEMLGKGQAKFCFAAALPTNAPGANQPAHSFSNSDGMFPFPDIATGINIYVWPVGSDQVFAVTRG